MNASRYEFSARVDMDLQTSHGKVDVRQCGGNLIVARHNTDIPPGEGVFTISVDGRVERTRVYLPDGIIAGEHEHRMLVIEDRAEWLQRHESRRQRLVEGMPASPRAVNAALAG